METQFNPYRAWLQIQVDDEPPDYYQLLGVNRWETNPLALRDGFGLRYEILHRYMSGKYGERAQKLVEELQLAYSCLSDPVRKQIYDRQLRTRYPAESPVSSTDFKSEFAVDPPPVLVPIASQTVEPQVADAAQGLHDALDESGHRATPSSRQAMRIAGAFVVCSCALAIVMLLSIRGNSKPTEPGATAANETRSPHDQDSLDSQATAGQAATQPTTGNRAGEDRSAHDPSERASAESTDRADAATIVPPKIDTEYFTGTLVRATIQDGPSESELSTLRLIVRTDLPEGSLMVHGITQDPELIQKVSMLASDDDSDGNGVRVSIAGKLLSPLPIQTTTNPNHPLPVEIKTLEPESVSSGIDWNPSNLQLATQLRTLGKRVDFAGKIVETEIERGRRFVLMEVLNRKVWIGFALDQHPQLDSLSVGDKARVRATVSDERLSAIRDGRTLDLQVLHGESIVADTALATSTSVRPTQEEASASDVPSTTPDLPPTSDKERPLLGDEAAATLLEASQRMNCRVSDASVLLWTPNSQQLIIGGSTGSKLLVHDVQRNAPVVELVTGQVSRAAVSSGSMYVLCYHRQNNRLFGLTDANVVWTTRRPLTYPITVLPGQSHMSANGQVAACLFNNQLEMIDFGFNGSTSSIRIAASSNEFALSPTGDRVATWVVGPPLQGDERLLVISGTKQSDNILEEHPLPGRGDKVSLLAWLTDDEDHETILARAEEGVLLWRLSRDVAKNAKTVTPDSYPLPFLRPKEMAWSPNGRYLALLVSEGLTLVDTFATKTQQQVSAHGAPHLAAFSHDNERLAVGYESGEIVIWDLPSGVAMYRMRVRGKVSALAWSPNGQWLATSEWDHQVRRWNLSGQPSASPASEKDLPNQALDEATGNSP